MEKVLMIKGNNIDAIERAARELGGKVVELISTDISLQAEPEEKCGTCSSCEHFQSRRTNFDRGGVVKWGYCSKFGGAAVNEHKKQCSAYFNSLPKLYVYSQSA